ncbi:MAG: PEP-CTERM sorting domain-containing protein [Alphaproteobacteria bacterium]
MGQDTFNSYSNVLPGGVDYGGSRQNDGFTVDLSHPFITGIGFGGASLTASGDFNGANGWNSTSHGFLTDLPVGSTVIVDHAVGAQMVEYAYGNGLVIGSGLTFGWGSGSARTDALDNLLLYGEFAASNLSTPVPEPAALALTLVGLASFALIRRKKSI